MNGGMVGRVAGAMLALAAGGCRSAMTTTIENRGDPLELKYLCGDAMYQTTLGSGGTVTWTPVANSCGLDVIGPSATRRFSLRNDCRRTPCEVSVSLPAVASTTGIAASPFPRLTGSGQIDVVGDVATVVAR
jgi:hypothetical protein